MLAVSKSIILIWNFFDNDYNQHGGISEVATGGILLKKELRNFAKFTRKTCTVSF